MSYTLKMFGPAGVLLLLLQLMHVYSQQERQVPNAYINCTFESNCPDIIYDVTDDHSYGWRKVRIPTSSSGTGPDMNTGNAKPGFYLYADASYGNDGDKASVRIRFPIQANSSHFCLSFRYHMYGADVGRLDVKLTVDSPFYEEGLFSMRGNQRNIWHEERVEFQAGKFTKLSLNIEARRGNGHAGDIAIDDIYLFKAKCSEFCELWQSWASCSVTCGQGLKLRTRQCNGELRYELARCDEIKCPAWGPWGPWQSCSRTCGQGSQRRTRRCQHGTQCVGASRESRYCTETMCPAWGPWVSWQSCSRSCGQGTKIRTRSCQHGTSCVGSARESKGCIERICPSWALWGRWQSCSTTCGQGTHIRTRRCQHGTSCVGARRESKKCTERVCPAVWGPWGAPSKCSVTYGYGVRKRSRPCVSGPCTGLRNTETFTCFENPWNAPPFWTPWSPPSRCTASCGYGTSMRNRTCASGSCKGQIQTQSLICHTAHCQEGWGQWSRLAGCSRSCGYGTVRRTRSCSSGQCAGQTQSKTVSCFFRRCPNIMECDFERDDCKLLNISSSSNWYRASRSSFGGISGDHTTGKGHFLGNNGSSTEYLNVITINESSEVCLRLWSRQYRYADPVFIKTSHRRLISVKARHSDLWTLRSVTTNGIGLQIGCRRCEIDDISVQVGRCTDEAPKCRRDIEQITATETGHIFSPGFLQQYAYPVNNDCSWLITASDPSAIIEVTPQTILITDDDSLLIHDGKNHLATLIARYGIYNRAGHQFQSIYSSGTHLFIKFESGPYTADGFNLKYKLVRPFHYCGFDGDDCRILDTKSQSGWSRKMRPVPHVGRYISFADSEKWSRSLNGTLTLRLAKDASSSCLSFQYLINGSERSKLQIKAVDLEHGNMTEIATLRGGNEDIWSNLQIHVQRQHFSLYFVAHRENHHVEIGVDEIALFQGHCKHKVWHTSPADHFRREINGHKIHEEHYIVLPESNKNVMLWIEFYNEGSGLLLVYDGIDSTAPLLLNSSMMDHYSNYNTAIITRGHQMRLKQIKKKYYNFFYTRGMFYRALEIIFLGTGCFCNGTEHCPYTLLSCEIYDWRGHRSNSSNNSLYIIPTPWKKCLYIKYKIYPSDMSLRILAFESSVPMPFELGRLWGSFKNISRTTEFAVPGNVSRLLFHVQQRSDKYEHITLERIVLYTGKCVATETLSRKTGNISLPVAVSSYRNSRIMWWRIQLTDPSMKIALNFTYRFNLSTFVYDGSDESSNLIYIGYSKLIKDAVLSSGHNVFLVFISRWTNGLAYATYTATGPIIRCDFEVDNCLQQEDIDQFDWKRQRGNTPSTDTGPAGDINLTGHYMYIESSSPRREGDEARLSLRTDQTPEIKCLKFWYHMNGETVGSLRVEGYSVNEASPQVLFYLSGHCSLDWNVELLDLDENTTHVHFVGVVGYDYHGDIAVDEVTLYPGKCYVEDTFRGTQGNITGLVERWNSYFPDGRTWRWRIILSNLTMRVRLEARDVEIGSNYLHFYDGGLQYFLFSRRGHETGYIVESSGHHLLVGLYSRSSVPPRKFSLFYRAIDTPTFLTSANGSIYSPGFLQGKNYGKYLNVVWRIRVPNRKARIQLRAETFHTDYSGVLYVHDGPYKQASLLAEVSRSHTGIIAQSSGSYMFLNFKTNSLLTNRGFSLIYNSIV